MQEVAEIADAVADLNVTLDQVLDQRHMQRPVAYLAASGPALTRSHHERFCVVVNRAGRPGGLRYVRLAHPDTRKAFSQT
jgi:hypothetical protein